MDYDVVIATMNRPNVLRVSIPFVVRQEPPPHQLIVVDASNDDVHEQVRQSVTQVVGDSGVYFEVLRSKANLPHQRNVGLEHVQSPVVMFLDDDSLWWPGVAKAILRIYELDTKGDIGGVCTRESSSPPPGIDMADIIAKTGYKMSKPDVIRQQINRFRHKFDDRFCPDPLWIHGRSCWNVRPFPEWLSNIDAALVELMGGARMSFRTEVIREYGFDKDLGAYVGWAAYEDADASFKVLQNRLIVGAHEAGMYHYRAPGNRANGFKLGFILLFNRAYIICRYSPPGSLSRAMLKRFALYKMSQYMLNIGSKFGRDRVKGTISAIKMMKYLLDTPAENLRQRYLELCQEVLHRNPANR